MLVTEISSNMSDNDTDLMMKLHREEIYLLAPVIAYMCILMVLGIVGNSLVCYVYGKRLKRTTGNSFILWLAVLDLSTCVIGIPMEIYDIVQHYFFDSPVFCKLLRFTIYLTVMTSVATLVFIAFNRYFKICKHHRKTWLEHSRGPILISIAMGLTTSWPSLVLFGRNKVNTPYPGVYGVDCGIDESVAGTLYPPIYLSILVLAFLCGATILTVLYTLIGIALRKHNLKPIGSSMKMHMDPEFSDNGRKSTDITRGRGAGSQSGTSRKSRKRYKVARNSVVFITITIAFVLSFLPSLALMTVATVKSKFSETLTPPQFVAYSLFLRFYFINNSINPLIYGFLNQLFRLEVVAIVRRFTNKRNSGSSRPVSMTSE